MNFKDTALLEHAKIKRSIQEIFSSRQKEANSRYSDALEEAFSEWCDAPTFTPANKRKYLKKKCMALISMDKEQIFNADCMRIQKALSNASLEKKLKQASVQTSVWFVGER